jgi:putative ABC transport system permease protein
MLGSTLRIAWRNLGRNKRRTALALAAIAVAQTAVLLVDGLMNGFVDNTLESLTGPMVGDLQLHHPEWREEQAPDLVIEDIDGTLEAVRRVDGVETAFARLYSPALAAKDIDGFAVQVIGLQVEEERAPGGLLEGLPREALPQAGHVLVGSRLALEQDLEVGDELAIMGSAADGSIANDLLVVSGILRTPVETIDRAGLLVPLASAQEIFVMEGQAHEITVHGEGGPELAEALTARVAAVPAVEGLEALSWNELAPQLAQFFQLAGYYGYVVMVIVFLAAAAGVVNTMLMATYERRRELGMMLSVGAAPRRLILMIVYEAVLLGLLGVLLGTVLGSLLVAWQGAVGLEFFDATNQRADVAIFGVSFSRPVYPYLTLNDVWPGFIAIGLVSVLSALWPAIGAARMEPVEAMRG